MTDHITVIRRLLTKKQLRERLPLANGTLHAWMNPRSPYFKPDFPRPIRPGGRSPYWIESEVDAWIAAWAEKRNQL